LLPKVVACPVNAREQPAWAKWALIAVILTALLTLAATLNDIW
jgi:hypothetical protein